MKGDLLPLNVLNVMIFKLQDVGIVERSLQDMYAKGAHFQVRIKMSKVIITLKIMPESVDINLNELESKIKKEIFKFSKNKEIKIEVEPVAFGLKALKFIFVMDEKLGSTENLENKISTLEGVNSVQVTDVRRAIG